MNVPEQTSRESPDSASRLGVRVLELHIFATHIRLHVHSGESELRSLCKHGKTLILNWHIFHTESLVCNSSMRKL